MGDVSMLLASVEDDENAARGRLIDALQPCELARRFRTPRDRAHFVVGRALIRYGLRTIYGVASGPIEIGEHGKPFLAESTGLDIHFSLAHSAGIVVCAFSRGSVVGVDVENCLVADTAEMADIVSSYFSAEERGVLQRFAEDERFDCVLRLWTLKEAAAKAVGLGLQLPLDSLVFSLDPPRLLSAGAELGDLALWHFEERMFANARISLAAQRRYFRKLRVTFSVVPLAAL
nr:4'-phosphopantetheinyl transferase superfamily protein [Bradyrhizobium sp. 2S1]MCK7664916.1 4'-phosphopantetheinyl transferase superfamily protein [Bradyrhizobium sp. 2S1]